MLGISIAAIADITPIFFVQDKGPTLLRQSILFTSIIFYVQSFVLLILKYLRTRSLFIVWFALSLGSIALGLILIMLQLSVGSMINILGRFLQYFGYMCALVSIFLCFKSAKDIVTPVSQAIANFFDDSEDNDRSLVDSIPFAIISLDSFNRILSWNLSSKLLFGLSEQEVQGKVFTEIVLSDKNLLCQDAPDSKHLTCEHVKCNILVNGHQWIPVDVSITSRNSTTGLIHTLLIKDLSEQILYEKEMDRLSCLNTVGEMAAAIGHEIRNPLTTVRGFLQLMQRKNEYSKHREYLNIMIEELDRANQIISDFLSLAKNRSIELKRHNLNNVIMLLQPLLEAEAIHTSHELNFNLSNIPDFNMDEREIRQLLLNLIKNAFEAMEPGGVLTIATSVEQVNVVLIVRDTGKGIPKEILNKLGTPFQTTKEKGAGLGWRGSAANFV